MDKRSLERLVKEQKAEIERLRDENGRLRDENGRLRHGKATFRNGSDEFVAVGKIDWSTHPQSEAIMEVPSRLCCEGKCLSSAHGPAPEEMLLHARYQLIYEDWQERIDPAARYYLIDYNYDRNEGTSINAVWLLEKVGVSQ